MTYTKPELTALGDAVDVIQQTGLKTGSSFDGVGHPAILNPDYDLDA